MFFSRGSHLSFLLFLLLFTSISGGGGGGHDETYLVEDEDISEDDDEGGGEMDISPDQDSDFEAAFDTSNLDGPRFAAVKGKNHKEGAGHNKDIEVSKRGNKGLYFYLFLHKKTSFFHLFT